MEMDVKTCRYCGSEIAASAKICPTCRYYQSSWRNLIVFCAGITGFITLVISGFAFIADRTSDFYKNWTWKDDAHVVSLTTGLSPNFSLVVSNTGSGPIFVSDIIINWQRGNSSLNVNQRIGAGEFLRVGDAAIPGAPDYNAFVYSRSGRPSQDVVNNAAIDEVNTPNKHCFLLVYFLPDSGDIERMSKFYSDNGQKLATEQATGRIVFFSLGSKAKIRSEFPVTATFVRSSADRCQKIPFD